MLQSPHPPSVSPSVRALLILPAAITLMLALQEDIASVMLAPQGPITQGLGVLAQARSWCLGARGRLCGILITSACPFVSCQNSCADMWEGGMSWGIRKVSRVCSPC